MSENRVKLIKLPEISFAPERLNDPTSRRVEMEKLIDSFSTVGFCLIKDLVGYDSYELLKATKWFHAEVPEEIKFDQLATKAFNPKNSNIYRGYFPLIPNQLSHKKGYDFGPLFTEDDIPPGKEGNPFTENTPILKIPGQEKEVDQFYEVMRKHQALLKNAANTIMSLIAEAGGEKSDFFDYMFAKCPMHTFRPIMYPKRVSGIPKEAYLPDGRIISTPAHMDSGFLTLLQTFGYPGLEIQVDNEWFAVDCSKEAIVVNLGEQMTEMSNGRFKSTIHRVIDIGEDRFSIPFFYEPSFSTNINTKIPRSLLPKGSEKNYPETDEFLPFGTFLLNKLPIYCEYAKICDNLPQWMREEYLDAFKNRACWASRSGIKTDGSARKQNLQG